MNLSLETILHKRVVDAYNKILLEVKEEFTQKATDEFRKRFGREMAQWALSTTSHVSLTADAREVVVRIKVDTQVFETGDRGTMRDAVLGKPST